jgi:hypothetical protein
VSGARCAIPFLVRSGQQIALEEKVMMKVTALTLFAIALVSGIVQAGVPQSKAASPAKNKAASPGGDKLATPYTRKAPTSKKAVNQILFDDLNYSNGSEFEKNGWIIRTAPGWPGIPGASWRKEGVTFLNDENGARNRFLRMTSSTDGTGANTYQTQICQQRKYFEGTYAARVRFNNDPVSGPAGDQLVQSFYAIAPLKAPMDPDYSELDFEYLPKGGWGSDGPTLFATSWRTFSPEPNWQKDNVFNTISGSQAGWHTLVTQVADQKVRYFIDGKPIAEHTGAYYPRSIMSLNFNLWFIKDQTVKSSEVRKYNEDIDWVFYEAKTALTPEEVESKVASMRKLSVKFKDTVPPQMPALTSPCNF